MQLHEPGRPRSACRRLDIRNIISMHSRYTLSRIHVRALLRNPITLSLLVYTAIILSLIFPRLTMYSWSVHVHLVPVVRDYELGNHSRANGPVHGPWRDDWASR